MVGVPVVHGHHELPGPDGSGNDVIGRLARLEYFLSRLLLAQLDEFGLSVGEFGVIAALRRSGPPFRQSPQQLRTQVLITAGGLSNRISRLEVAALVVRRPDPDDRRGVLIELTEKGLRVVEAAAERHIATEHALLAPLSAAERRQLAALLRKLLLLHEPAVAGR
ncbi:MarR family transcriptional regulator [Crenobacter sp. SG2305]|uniref:MarR family winged helix-turn-helix transcriptional regulator n=1 Tax=Crenobacter oryzisoli TaxID=3056844 RepID=UPI0025AADBA0|nr:MarR family transcriptional regulator [Crenobacter sp. SG2305]MDN0084286.1 MarR family transcriptional regulator [Crenobacter sp. SG2305]